MLLYKYCDQAGIGILRSRTIWLSRPRAFNDPFDVNPHIDKFDEPIRMGAYVFQKTNDIVVLSLAENCKSLLMWAHYAEHHRGFLIGFNGGGRILDDGLVARLPLDAMSYCHHRPSADRVKHLSDQKLYFTKSSEWAYEQEWRLVTSNLFGPNGPALEVKPDTFSFQLMTKDIRTVIVGHRAAALLPEMYTILREPDYRHVSLKLALPHVERFELQLKNWPRAKWGEAAPPELLGYNVNE
jgi:hypothetical protein